MTLNAIEAIARVRERIHDRAGDSFDDDEILRAFDDAVRKIHTEWRTHGDSQGLDYVDVDVSSLTLLEPRVYAYILPEFISDLQMVELVTPGIPAQVVSRASLAEKDIARGTFVNNSRLWLFGAPGTIQLRGDVSGWPTMRLWFVRAIPPLVHGTATSGSTTTTITPQTVKGAWKARPSIYVASQFEITASSDPSNVGIVRRCTAFSGGVLTLEAFPASAASCTWAMVLPVPDENTEYLVSLATLTMLRRQGSSEEVGMLSAEVAELAAQFASGISRRTSGEPPRLASSRRFR